MHLRIPTLSFRPLDPVYYGLGTAILFGCGAPLAKLMLAGISPMVLAGLLYLGSGAGLLLYLAAASLAGRRRSDYESAPKRSDLPWLTGVVICGGFLAPLVLMISLRNLGPATAALLLNFEVVMTTLLASLVFREAVGKRVFAALLCITAACLMLTYLPGASIGISLPAVGVLFACTLWGLDNNFSRNVSLRDPVLIVIIKGFGGGLLSLGAGILIREPFPSAGPALAALILGFVCYGGLTSVLFLMALRGLGSARAGSLLAVSPLFGCLLSWLIFSPPLSLSFFAAVPVMVVGVALLLTEDHAHLHTHPPLAHEHRHRHDDLHHTHSHRPGPGGWDPGEEHCHLHAHEENTHAHSHRPDIHHRHLHGGQERDGPDR